MDEPLSILGEPAVPPVAAKDRLGTQGERLAADHLTAAGYRLIAANFTTPIGRNLSGRVVTGEIDIVALDGETLCFIEVKTRRSDEYAPITAAVNLRKQRQITRTAHVYRRLFAVTDWEYRFDVATVHLPRYAEPEVELHRGFFSDVRFYRGSWARRGWNDFV